MLPDGDQQQAVLGQPLHRPHQDIGQPQPIALFVGLAPRQIGREEAVVPVELAAVELAGALLRTVLGVGRKQLRECRESGDEEIDAHRVARRDAVLDHREQVERPERQIRLAELADVGKELVLVDIREQVLGLDRL